MAKFCGEVGYGEAVETPQGSGVWVDEIVERKYFGDIVRNARSLDEGETLHKRLSVSNSISIVADAYAHQHFFAIRYVKWSGALWEVSNVEVQSPRLILRLGGVYNGPSQDGTAGGP